jgi:hypothetical protein
MTVSADGSKVLASWRDGPARRAIINWVEAYAPDQIGDGKYLPHITVGVAKFDSLKVIEAAPFDAFAVHPKSVSVYHLGNNGTARQLLKSWPVTSP